MVRFEDWVADCCYTREEFCREGGGGAREGLEECYSVGGGLVACVEALDAEGHFGGFGVVRRVCMM